MKIRHLLMFGITVLISVFIAMGYANTLLFDSVLDVHENELPMQNSLHQVEVDLHASAEFLNLYRLTGDEQYEDLYWDHSTKLEEGLAEYALYVESYREVELIRALLKYIDTNRLLSRDLIAKTQIQMHAEENFFLYVDQADDIIDFKMQTKNLSMEQEKSLREVEVSIWEAIHAAQQYVGLGERIVRSNKTYYAIEEDTVEYGARSSIINSSFREIMKAQFIDVEEYFEIFKNNTKDESLKEAILEFESVWGRAIEEGYTVVNSYDQAEEVFNEISKETSDAAVHVGTQMAAEIDAKVLAEDTKIRKYKLVVIIFVIAVLLFVFPFATFVYRTITRPIHKLRIASEKVEDGDFSVRTNIKSSNEYGILSEAFDEMVAAIQKRDKKLQQDNEKLHELNSMKDDFIATVSHELKTPLTAIKSYTQIINDGIVGEVTKEQKEALDVIDESATSLSKMISNILTFSSYQHRNNKVMLADANVHEIVEDVIAEHKASFEQVGAQVQVKKQNAPCIVYTNDEKLKEILRNLVTNAIKYRSPKRKLKLLITIQDYSSKEHVQIRIKDNGIGIEKTEQKKIFDKFYQIEQHTKRKQEGAGIGLSVVKFLSKAIRADVSLRSVYGKGSEFMLHIPKGKLKR